MKLFWLLPFLVALAYSDSNPYVEKECSCSLDKLWVDVVVAIDTSAGMTANGLTQVLANIVSVYGQSTISQNGGQTSRVGIITYNDAATTQFNLTYFTSTDQLMDEIWNIPAISASPTSDIKKGLQAAADLLAAGRTVGNWDNVRTAIIVYASDYNGQGENNPLPLATQIRGSGTDIITVAFNQGGEERVLNGLKDLATPGMAFTNTDPNMTGAVQQALCQVNCYCLNSWKQFTDSYTAPQKRYGSCLKFGEIDAIWVAAQRACQSMAANGFLTTEFNSQKHNFNTAFAKDDSTQATPYSYHIGLRFYPTTSTWEWEQPVGQPRIVMDPAQNNYTSWNAGYPSQTVATTPCVLSSQAGTSFRLGWQDESCTSVSKRYLCQASSCDTDQYCS